MGNNGTFIPGDIFIVEDQGSVGGKPPSRSLAAYVTRIFLGLPTMEVPDTASAIHWLQSKSRNKNAQYVHAGIIIDDEHVIEMAGPGIKLGKISEELGGKKVAVFRCRDKEVTELALDLAINMEKTLVEDAFPQMASRKTDKNFGPIKYDFLGAGRALCAKTRKEKQITQLHKELLDIATSMNIPHKPKKISLNLR